MKGENVAKQNIIINCAFLKCICGEVEFRVDKRIISCNSCNRIIGELVTNRE